MKPIIKKISSVLFVSTLALGLSATAQDRYVKIVALSEINNNPWASLAELNVTSGGVAINQSGWSLQGVNSEETSGEDGAATNAFDGDNNSIWHTEWSGSSPTHPHSLEIDLGASYNIDGFSYLPRQYGSNGGIAQYEFYTSADGVNWGTAAASGTFDSSSALKEVSISGPVPGDTVHEWSFGEGGGYSVADSVGSLSGSITGASWSSRSGNSSLSFDGTDDYIDINGAEITGDWSLGLWVNRSSDTISSILLASDNYSIKLEQWGQNQQVGFTHRGVADYAFSYATPVGQWTHLTFVKNSGGISLYANGSFVDSNNQTIPLPLTRIGSSTNGVDDLHAGLDEVDVYSKALTSEEVAALYTVSGGTNPRPDVIPSLREWSGGSGQFTLSGSSRILINPSYASSLSDKANAFRDDIYTLTGKYLSIVQSRQPVAGDIYLTMGASDSSIGSEGYLTNIGTNITISAQTADGAFMGTRTLLQILKRDPGMNNVPQGNIKDYPHWENRGMLLDVGRMFMPIDFLRDMVKQMSYFKMNDLQLHINDNVIQFDSSEWRTANSGFRLESDSHPGLTSAEHYTKQEYISLIALADQYGVNIITEIDAPAHSLAFTQYMPSIRHPQLKEDHLDLGNSATTTFLEELWDEYAPIIRDVHIGTDEYNNGSPADMKAFINHFNRYLKGYGKGPVRMWGSQDTIGGAVGLDRDLLVNIWYKGYYHPTTAVNDGYNIINTEDAYLYIVPKAGYYHDYLNTNWLYNNWTPNTFSGDVSFGINDPQVKGGMFAVWNDAFANGTYYTPADVQDRVKPAMQTLSQKMWAAGTAMSYPQFQSLMNGVDTAPGSFD